MKISKNKGFTLIELMVVISIIALLSSVTYASLSATRVSARNVARAQQTHQLNTAIKLYQLDHDGAVPNLASVTGAGCSYTNTANASNCVAKSSGNAAWTAFAAEISPYMRSVPAGIGNIDYIYMAPAAMGNGATNSSYQISSDLENSLTNIPTGYTTGAAFVSYPAGGVANYSIILKASPNDSTTSSCLVKIGAKVYNCNSIATGYTAGTYGVVYLGGYLNQTDPALVPISPNPVVITNSNISVTIGTPEQITPSIQNPAI